ncbi:SMC family ATPase [Candidatus Woesearchaeota archaeon]|nr:SMC family ATPase [Candidatus Woesearchaeota archaeon]
MILKSLRLHNIRSYVDETMDFPEGSVLLSGDIGSGKSTILLAIEFALFGTKGKQLSGSTLLRHGENSGSVELGFSLGEKRITVKRTLKRTRDGIKQEAGFLIVDDIKKEGTVTELKTWILELLGYPNELVSKSSDLVFRYTVYTPQEGMKQILFDDSETRLDTLRRIFQIDKYKVIQENAEFFVRLLKERMREQEGKVSDLEDKKKELSEKKEEAMEQEHNLKSVSQLLQTVLREKEDKEAEITAIEEKQKHLLQIKEKIRLNSSIKTEKFTMLKQVDQRISIADSRIDDLRKKLDVLKIEKPSEKTREQLETCIEKDLKLISEIRQNKFELNKNLAVVSQKIAELDLAADRKKEIEDKKAKLEKEISLCLVEIGKKDSVKKGIVEARSSLDSANVNLQELLTINRAAEEVLEKIKTKDKCPVCEQSISPYHRHSLNERQLSKIRQNSERIEVLRKQKSMLDKSILESERILESLFELEKRLEKSKAELAAAGNELGQLSANEAQLVNLRKEKFLIEKNLSEINKNDINAIQQRMEDNKAVLKEIIDYTTKLSERESYFRMLKDKGEERRLLLEQKKILADEMARLDSETAAIALKQRDFEGIEEKYAALKNELKKILDREKQNELRIAEMKTIMKNTEEAIKRLAAEIDSKEIIKKNIVRLSQLQNWVDKLFINLVASMEKQVMLKLYSEFNEFFLKWFDTLIEDESLAVRLDDEFSPVIEQNGYETTVSNLSGGERTSCALAYRLALNKVINDFISEIKTKSLIILDEPTDGFSTEQLDKMRDVLEQLDSRQIIVVSHESKIESYVENVVRISKIDGISSVL